MKAYNAWTESSECTTIVFAENAGKARAAAMKTDCCEDSSFTDIRVNRNKNADFLYRGKSEIDWDDDETRIILVRDFDWACFEPSCECNGCPAKEFCKWTEKEKDGKQNDL